MVLQGPIRSVNSNIEVRVCVDEARGTNGEDVLTETISLYKYKIIIGLCVTVQ